MDTEYIETIARWGKNFVEIVDPTKENEVLRVYFEPKGVQVNVKEFVRTVIYKEDIVGRPVIWAQWPNEENT